MVRAILDGRKTQTRRVVKWSLKPLVPDFSKAWIDPGGTDIWGPGPYLKVPCEHPADGPDGRVNRVFCPYGVAGDQLWVKETFCKDGDKIAFRDDGWIGCPSDDGKWTPSIFMPRAASRIQLEVTEVRVQRVQEISEEDAIAEGVEGHRPSVVDGRMYRRPYEILWDSINAKRGFGWAVNPWVWAITFRRIRP
jgi:hypothetical protein